MVATKTRSKAPLACSMCHQQVARWVGRCPGCGSWGSIEEGPVPASGGHAGHPGLTPDALVGPEALPPEDRPVSTGYDGLDRVLGSGLVPSSVVLLAGEPGIGKSTLLLHLMNNLAIGGRPCLLVSGEESLAQVSARARRLGVEPGAITFAPGRDLDAVIQTAHTARPFLLAVDSIQALRDTSLSQTPGGVSQVRLCTDALVGLAKSEGMAVVLTGHVTKDGDLAGPRTLEHAVDTVLTFEGDPRSGLRVLAGGKNRYGAEGETAWFEMGPGGLREIDPTQMLVSVESMAGAAVALPQAGRRALAVEVQALVVPAEGPARRQATGLDARRFQLVAAVLGRAGVPLDRSDLFGASSGGVKIDDPACDLALAAALASAASGAAPPPGSAFMGEVTLTGSVRASPSAAQRFSAARGAGCTTVFAAPGAGLEPPEGIHLIPVRRVQDALRWALPRAGTGRRPT